MRKVLALALTVALGATLATPLTLLAQQAFGTVTTPAGTVAGRSVDVMGRGVIGERVELVRGTQVIHTATTNGLGEWSFSSVEPGEYVVRMNVRGRIAGVRVTVGAGQAVSGTMVVVPAATASLQLGTLANLVALFPTAAAATAAVAQSATLDVDTTDLDEGLLVQILGRMNSVEREAFARAVVAALDDDAEGSGIFEQYRSQFQDLVDDPDTIPNFPPPDNES